MKALLDMEATVPKDKELALECQVRHRFAASSCTGRADVRPGVIHRQL